MQLSGARVLVAGGSGFIGTNLIARLLSEGCWVRATLHTRQAVIEDPAIEYLTADLTSMEDCRRVVDGVDYVFMCAASTSGAAVIQANPLVHVTPNVVMNAQLLEAAYLAKVKKFTWMSSNAAYPPTGDRPAKEEELFDGDPYDVYFGVAWMKRYTETLCRFYSQYLDPAMTTVVLRPSNIYGPHDDFDFATSHVTAAMIRKVVERHDPIEMWGTGDDIRDVIYIDDFIDAIMLAVEKTTTYDPVNVGLGQGYSLKEILKTIREVDGYTDVNIRYDPSKPSTVPMRPIDTTKAQAVLGFKATTSLRDGLRKTVEWYRESRDVLRPDATAR
ncbi:MAG: NAD-dependent epimerase/dehydratase family protein [Dehalococcoidia bacterium]|jgi:GDP-L-fucose synthase|nr:NAD-dependent epimerase/dehydratase family protein [Dehalococcoidia bacterium]